MVREEEKLRLDQQIVSARFVVRELGRCDSLIRLESRGENLLSLLVNSAFCLSGVIVSQADLLEISVVILAS